jgi:hypothetical protein
MLRSFGWFSGPRQDLLTLTRRSEARRRETADQAGRPSYPRSLSGPRILNQLELPAPASDAEIKYLTALHERFLTMPHLTIKLSSLASHGSCGLCGKATTPAVGPRLCLDDGREAVCRECGKRHAPALAALVDLAHVADRVGRIGRHTLVPPFDALLDLARAAENYNDSRVKPHKQVA